MVRFVDEDEIDTRYWEKPYYLVPDGDEADEGYAIMQRALAETGNRHRSTHHGRAGASGRHQSVEGWIDAFHPSLCR